MPLLWFSVCIIWPCPRHATLYNIYEATLFMRLPIASLHTLHSTCLPAQIAN